MTRLPTILVRVAHSGEPSHIGTLAIEDWCIPCTIGAGGLVQASFKREGDKRTPAGVFPLRYGFFDSKALPAFPRDLAFPFVPLSSEMIWEEEGAHYNRLVFSREDERLDERLNRPRDGRLFDVIIPIGFNDAVPETGRGSALFIHAAGDDMRGTAGCIGVPREHMMDLVRRLEPGAVIDIGYVQAGDERRQGANESREGPGDPLEAVRFIGLRPGPRLLVMGAVHGNESCGPQAILRAISDCRAGRISILRGEVTFVPVANLKAYRQNTREGDRNLNRDLREKTVPDDYEAKVGNRICALLRENDILLDIHSFRGEGEPFVFAGPLSNAGEIEPFRLAKAEGEFAARLGTNTVIHGWLGVYNRFLKERERLGYSNRTNSEGVGTTEYMRFSGGYGVTLECGSHDDPNAVEVGYAAISNALAHLELTDAPAPEISMRNAVQIVDVVLNEADGDRLEGSWKTGDPVAAGRIIVRRANGEVVVAPSAGFMVFPNDKAKPGDGFCYFGVTSERTF
jgi:L,D-peptidoglycan transpeptidase YkuD (ErfK/YbiS/YcfS/YnhG family)/predicted deacylase